MFETNKNNQNLRFFSNSSLFKKIDTNEPMRDIQDPTPFGLNFQEDFAMDKHKSANTNITMGQSPTNTPTGSDTCVDLDYEF